MGCSPVEVQVTDVGAVENMGTVKTFWICKGQKVNSNPNHECEVLATAFTYAIPQDALQSWF